MSILEEPAVFLKQWDYRESTAGINRQKLHTYLHNDSDSSHTPAKIKTLDENEQSRFKG